VKEGATAYAALRACGCASMVLFDVPDRELTAQCGVAIERGLRLVRMPIAEALRLRVACPHKEGK